VLKQEFMRYSEFLKAVQERKISPVVTFLGEEAFLKDRALDTVLNRFLDSDSRAFNFRSLIAEEVKDTAFLDEASTMPMFGEWKVVYIKHASLLEKILGRIKEYLEEYIANPSQGTLLIFDLDRWEGSSKLKAILSKKTMVVEFNPLSEKEIPSWITGHLRSLNFQIETAAVQALTERLGTDLQKISAELEKLMLFRQSERKICLQDVETAVGYTPTAKIWDWTDALMDQNATRSVELLHDLLEQEEQPVYCIALLAKQYQKMILAKEMVIQKIPPATIAQKINKPVYYLQKYLAQLSRFRMVDLVKAIEILSFADRALKSGQAKEDRTILELVTLQLCNLKERAPAVFDVPLPI
jgi:DNA polymerase III subunit delta